MMKRKMMTTGNEREQCCCSGVAVEVRSFSDDCRTLYDNVMFDRVDFHL